MHRMLVIGVGSIGERHARCLQNTGRAAVGICETHDARRGEVAQRYGIEAAFASLDEALAQHWDAAVVATPAQTHVPIARRLASENVHLLIEKPLSVSTEGVAELIEDVRRRKLSAVVGYVYRAHPALAAMREALRSGRFGRPVQIVAVCGQHFPLYRPAYREIYYTDRATGGGAIQDALTHVLNAGEWLVGPIDRLTADAAHQLLPGVGVEDTVGLLARHGDVMGCYGLNQHQAPNELTITVVCEGGTARFEVHESRWRFMTAPGGQWQDQPVDIGDRDAWFIRQEQAFLDVLEGAAEPLCTLDEGLQTLRVNLAALASADTDGAWRTVREI